MNSKKSKKPPKIPYLVYSLAFGLIIISLIIIIIRLIQTRPNPDTISNQPSSLSTLPEYQITWEQTEQLMANCDVKSIFQQHNLKVTLRSKSDQIYYTIEPEIDAIMKLAQKYQGPCDIIQTIATE